MKKLIKKIEKYFYNRYLEREFPEMMVRKKFREGLSMIYWEISVGRTWSNWSGNNCIYLAGYNGKDWSNLDGNGVIDTCNTIILKNDK